MDKTTFDEIFEQMEGRIAQDPRELWNVVQRLNTLQPKRILEIGVDKGGTTRFWQLLSESVVAIDLDPTKVEIGFSGRKYPLLIKGDSTNKRIIKLAKESAPYDFLWIDGGHDYETAVADWNNYTPMVRRGGFVGIHDVRAPDTGPDKLLRQVRDLGLYHEVFYGHKGTALIEAPE